MTSQGQTEFIDIGSCDEGQKVFPNKVSDGRKVFETGASVLVRDIPMIGKVMVASFKDGNNLIGTF